LNLTNQSANKKRLLSVKYELTDIGKKMAQFPLGINFILLNEYKILFIKF
jgi:hypothetical protein